METVYVEVKVKLVIKKTADLTIDEIIQEMDYDFTPANDGVRITETEITEHREVAG